MAGYEGPHRSVTLSDKGAAVKQFSCREKRCEIDLVNLSAEGREPLGRLREPVSGLDAQRV